MHCLYTILFQSSPLFFFKKEEKISEQKIILKGDADGRDGNGAKVFAYIFHYCLYSSVSILSLCLLAHA